MWESKADGAFAISEDTYNEPMGRGTEIRLHLREEAGEYLEESKLKVKFDGTLVVYYMVFSCLKNIKCCLFVHIFTGFGEKVF